jgi:ADP-heptose:LPS heptosyltransferase
MNISKPSLLASRIIVFRSGGLGDILLTLPLLKDVENLFEEVMVCVPSKYHFLIKEFSSKPILFDLDRGEDELHKLARGAQVVSFWNDPAWVKAWKELGATDIHIFNPRPQTGTHFSQSLIERFTDSIVREELNRKCFISGTGSINEGLRNLWIHPGSGGVNKNLPLSEFLHLADNWLENKTQSEVLFSFGEADLNLQNEFSKLSFSKASRVKTKLFTSLQDFFFRLRMHDGAFAGNDSGPSHMAAMLGLETHVWFRSTSPAVWAPLGPKVKIYQADSVPSKIL